MPTAVLRSSPHCFSRDPTRFLAGINTAAVGNSGVIWTGVGGLTISRSRHPFRTAYLCVFTPSYCSCAAHTHQCFCVMYCIAHSAFLQRMCITAPWQNKRAVDEQSRCVHIGELGSHLGGNTVRGAKGQIFVVYLLGIRYHRLVILHLNKICFIVMPLPRRLPTARHQ